MHELSSFIVSTSFGVAALVLLGAVAGPNAKCADQWKRCSVLIKALCHTSLPWFAAFSSLFFSISMCAGSATAFPFHARPIPAAAHKSLRHDCLSMRAMPLLSMPSPTTAHNSLHHNECPGMRTMPLLP